MIRKTEQDIRTLIDIQLLNLKWRFEGDDKNVFQESPKFDKERKKLGNLRPDYILYNGDIPVAIIEAKRPDGDYDLAKKDGIKKAKLLGCQIIFVSDSSYTRCYKIGVQKEIYKNNNVIDSLLDLSTIIAIENTDGGIIDYGSVIKTSRDLIGVFKTADDILRECGFQQGFPRLIEFCNLLFIKLLSDINKDNNTYRWDLLTNRTGADLLSTYSSIIDHYNNIYTNILKIKNHQLTSDALRKLILLINDTGDLSQVNTDLKGEAFEYFLKKYQDSHSDLAQYFTPRHIVKFMVTLIDPKLTYRILDPFCGTGGMLIECFKYIKKNTHLKGNDFNQLKYNTIYGQDNSDSSKIAKMNMILSGDGHSNIKRADTLKNTPESIYDVVITNIPFNLKPKPKEKNIKCIRYCIDSLKETGKAYIIVPYSISEDDYATFRKEIKKYIETIIKLPSHTFAPYTNAKSFILVISKNNTHNKINYVEIKNDGFSKNKLREPINENDIDRFEKGHLIFTEINDFDEIDNHRYTTDYKNYKRLKDFLILQNNFITIENEKSYCEPSISGKNNKVSTRRKRLGKNIKGDSKKLIKKGNLVISTLHTQNGLFGIADKNYIANSQLVYELKPDVNRPVFFFLLNREIRKLSKDDVVGRETYKKEEIENIKIPILNSKQQEELVYLFKKVSDLEHQLKNVKKEINDYEIIE